MGFPAQRMAVDAEGGRPPDGANRQTVGAAPLEQVVHFVNKKMPGGLPEDSARAARISKTRTTCRSSRDPRPPRTPRRCSTFPAAAPGAVQPGGPGHPGHAVARGVQTVLPPGYLCCGYPQRGGNQFDKAEK